MECWRDSPAGLQPPPTGTFTQISTGGYQGCGVHTDGSLECWGDGADVPPAGTFDQVSVGLLFACGVRTDNTIACWGSDYRGETTPPAGTFTHVSAAEFYACGLRTDGTAECWGDSRYTAAPSGIFTQISAAAGAHHACGLRTDGSVECWGDDTYGQATPPSGPFVAVSGGYEYTCGLRPDSSVECWGSNSYGQTTPPSGPFVEVSATPCGLRPDGSVECWGVVVLAPPSQVCTVCGDGKLDQIEECDDGNLTPNDGCDDQCIPDCTLAARTDCSGASRSLLKIRAKPGKKDRLLWKFNPASPDDPPFSSPADGGRYLVCLYPDSGALGDQARLSRQGGWRVTSAGYDYKDDTRAFLGIDRVKLKATRVNVKAIGEGIADNLLPATSFTAQIVDTHTGNCWVSEFPTATVKPQEFKAKN